MTEAPTLSPTVSLFLGDSDGGMRAIEGFAGERLLDALLRARAAIIPVCGGRACCGGCRIRVEAPWPERLDPPGRSEARLLPHLDDPHGNDRLSCQIELKAALDGLAVRTIPRRKGPGLEPRLQQVQAATGDSE